MIVLRLLQVRIAVMFARTAVSITRGAVARSAVATVTRVASRGASRCARPANAVRGAHFARGTGVSLARQFSVAASVVPQQQSGQGPVKPKVQDAVYELSQADFQKKVMLSPVPVILDCYAECVLAWVDPPPRVCSAGAGTVLLLYALMVACGLAW